MRKIQHFKKRSRQFLSLALILMILMGMVPQVALAEEGTAADGNPVITEDTSTDETGSGEDEATSGDDAVTEDESDAADGDSLPAESESEETGDDAEIIYDPQPTTMAEVQAVIDAVNAVRTDAMASGMSALEALEAWIAAKPHWQYSIDEIIMPIGYRCDLVSDDADFGAEYYTFFLGSPVTYDATDTWNGSSVSPFTSGNGTAASPYEIYTCAQLAYLAQQVNAGNTTFMNANYILMADLDLNSYSWTPIGSTGTAMGLDYYFQDMSKAFCGQFNGNNRKIINLNVTGTSNSYRGLFGFTYNAAIHDLTIVDSTVSGFGFVGTLVGASVDNLSLINCNVINQSKTSVVSSTGLGCGGLVGHAAMMTAGKTLTIKNCDMYANISNSAGEGCVGGLVGRVRMRTLSYDVANNSTIQIEQCYVYGTITAVHYYVGGLIGHYYTLYASGVTMNINDCETYGDVTTTGSNGYYTGGAAGFIEIYGDNMTISITGVKTTGNIWAQGNDAYMVGGLIGYLAGTSGNNLNIDIINCHTTGNVRRGVTASANGGYSGGLIGSSILALGIRGGKLNIESCSATGDRVEGYGNNCYYNGGFYGYMCVFGYDFATTIKNCYSTARSFTRDGGGGYDVGGFGGYMATSGIRCTTTFENCYATGDTSSNTGAGNYVGGFAGYIYTHDTDAAAVSPGSGSGHNTTELKNCYATGNVTTTGTTGSYTGGFIGYFTVPAISDGVAKTSSASLSNCYATGNVTTTGTSSPYVGGLIGEAHNVNLHRCHANGNVTTTGSSGYVVGGLCGLISRGVSVTQSYATGNVSATGVAAIYVGGLVGEMLSNTAYIGKRGISSLDECYATGYVTGGSYYNGGLIGYLETSGRVTNCYAIGGVKGTGYQNGGLIGYAYGPSTVDRAIVTNCYSSGTVTNSTGNYKGGLIGHTYQTTVSNCFFDTTMSGMNVAVGWTELSTVDITGIKTEKMISVDTYSAWNISAQRGSGSNGSTIWYIDDNITYPYLWYQYEGHSESDTNYHLSSATYTKTGGSTGNLVDRTDFTTGTGSDGIDIRTSGGLTFNVTSAGATEAYYPYNHVKDPINKTSPTAVSSTNGWSIYSLGSISATDIVAYTNGPSAEKTSDRGNETYVGDTVTYTITLDNPEAPNNTGSVDYTWKDVVVVDELPGGLSFNSGTVVITYPDGSTVTATEGTANGQYQYNASSNVLTVYVGDIAAGKTATVEFKTTVLESAAGGIIRNEGDATGTFLGKTYTAHFDDENIVPVLNAYKVTYFENNISAGAAEANYVDGYYKTGVTYNVLGNNTTSFSKQDYLFKGWNTSRDGTGTAYTAGATFLMPGNNVVLYAQWEKLTTFTFLKVDAEDYTTALSGATFELYVCKEGAGHSHTSLNALISCWELVDTQSSADGTGGTTLGLVKFTELTDGEYLLVEKKAPTGYELAKGQWVIKIANGVISANGVIGNSDVPALKTPSSAQVTAGINLLVGNRAKYALPMSGSSGVLWFIVVGALLAAAGTAGLLWLKRRDKKAL